MSELSQDEERSESESIDLAYSPNQEFHLHFHLDDLDIPSGITNLINTVCRSYLIPLVDRDQSVLFADIELGDDPEFEIDGSLPVEKDKIRNDK
jgi:hypothetical protein